MRADARVLLVRADGSARWVVAAAGSSRVLGTFDTKPEAIRGAREIAERGGVLQVVVHRRDGAVQARYDYDGDPFRRQR